MSHWSASQPVINLLALHLVSINLMKDNSKLSGKAHSGAEVTILQTQLYDMRVVHDCYSLDIESQKKELKRSFLKNLIICRFPAP